jgi:hypothetical protein
MKYPWYEEICNSDNIAQGDIITNCPIPIPNQELFLALLDDKESFQASVDIKCADVIILSQACDVENNKVDSIVVCPVWSLKRLIATNSYYNSSKARESLRQGKEPSYHLLNEYKSPAIENEFVVADFHRIYSIPKSYLIRIAEKINRRLRLLPPYREHLSQAFARYFMRVGLPTDINKDSIKNVDSPTA